jgi:hypothetical protein
VVQATPKMIALFILYFDLFISSIETFHVCQMSKMSHKNWHLPPTSSQCNRHHYRLFSSDSDGTSIGNWDPYSAPKLDYDECYYKVYSCVYYFSLMLFTIRPFSTKVLEVEPSIGAKELKRAYYKIVFKYHPDNKVTDAEKDLANKQMMVINGAYRVLKDPSTRSQYDKQRVKGLFLL